jgi:DNA-binding transcriptional LysR family regulator
MRYSVRQLVHLAAVVDAGSLSLAADKLGLTQPALSKSLSQLEQRVGAPLLRRTKSGSSPTALGRMLAVQGETIISSVRRAEDQVGDWKRASVGHLVIGSPPSIAAYLMPSVIADFLATRPHVTMRVEVTQLSGLLEKIATNQMDMYVGVTRPTRVLDGFSNIPVYDDELQVFAREDHPIFKKPVTVADLARYRWTAPLQDSFFRGILDVALNNAGLPLIDVAMQTFSFDLQVSLLRQTDFLAMLPRKFGALHVGLRRIKDIEPDLPGRNFTVCVLRRDTAETSPLVMSFIDSLIKLESKSGSVVRALEAGEAG